MELKGQMESIYNEKFSGLMFQQLIGKSRQKKGTEKVQEMF